MFTALHACGDLSSHILNLFVDSDRATVLCLVGCCYNLLTEEFPSKEFHDNAAKQGLSYGYGFPMSSHLRNRSFHLGKNARSLASQPLDRLRVNQTVPSDTLFWRAVLQVILIEKLGNPKNKIELRVGKLNKKVNSFNEYVNKAIQKLNLDITVISDAEISDYYLRYSSHKDKYFAFYKLRTCMGPVIEALIQLDRLLFLLEQENTHSAFLIEIFDPVISPRCYSLIAIKQTSNERF
ncbi:hypothetical protein HELRODRAFT_65351 [Helobdella robusta]|uniref:Methyltransferase domain-containing protein n=1 Tax=Helobdella robusta TaxID=6412 RepID=T1FY66_HELRO|nr:hypothetical protein HELRODRAFT_65351 [Helobdella robusta]ESO02280.1 hypothetical protein HELRODRAFT_65351 [Helobdella robusta]